LHLSNCLYFYPGILETQTSPNQGKTEMRSPFLWRAIWLPCYGCHWGPTRSPWWIQSKEPDSSRIWTNTILVIHY
jgi:hypothetical protein